MRTRKKLLFVLGLAASVAGCESAKDFRYTADDAQSALNAQTQCALENVKNADDKMSDASTIALTLAQLCATEYRYANVVYASARLDNRVQRNAFIEKRSTLTAKVETFLPIVMRHRKAGSP